MQCQSQGIEQFWHFVGVQDIYIEALKLELEIFPTARNCQLVELCRHNFGSDPAILFASLILDTDEVIPGLFLYLDADMLIHQNCLW